MHPDKYNIKEPFTLTLSCKLTNAVNNLSGDVKIFADEDAPIMIRNVNGEEKGLSVIYLVTTF